MSFLNQSTAKRYDSTSSNDVIPKSVITIAVLAGAILVGVVVAKLVDICHDKRSLRDDASDMSEKTKEFLKGGKARLALMAFQASHNKEEPIKPDAQMAAKKMAKIWSTKTSKRTAKAAAEAAGSPPVLKSTTVIDPDSGQKIEKSEKVEQPRTEVELTVVREASV
ncbi:DgyrCDS13769 [Dimorphilus gyrociliatus]|uniref:DgyrCDS13769 n=1 Tax=Dimorphilus gyrociliatus TaxID=2664684 RepID=A0A7I8WBN0_9ANNE|nr:DgyrCDS13769 [Dimorphilus gyrociliatus]